jgi:hypothetical protein
LASSSASLGFPALFALKRSSDAIAVVPTGFVVELDIELVVVVELEL